MERIVAGVIRWAVLAAIFSPTAKCLGDSPSAATDHAKPLFKHHSYPDAWTAAQESNKPILVYVTMPQCPHCTKMLDGTYGCAEVSEMVTGSFETLEASRYTHALLVEKLHIKWYPSTVLVGSNNKVLDMIEGYVDSETFKRRLQLGIASANNSTQTR
ncbi:thioredoxin family protein [Bythopirellula polymerisocia]|uniref:Thioredoxin-like fold domain-containing protein n=1 Tax=Bythopirellula polymerisocia TaxID=2528003 RepID=A0A5C6CQX4_9BACT|nr:thioredoxin family protein [Bythopirellula polymerisocia]TWU25954.1 hypothetical protein Pla144_31680 [Bythopirellula polymerisocia]